jgi:hypothetical protein
MEPPKILEFPFFAYGVFKPGELAFLQIKDLVESTKADQFVKGEVRLRDGLPIADLEKEGELRGELITFRKGSENQAYQRIAALEPGNQYRWDVCSLGDKAANILVGLSPNKGSIYSEYEWEGRKDPLFTDALDVIAETLDTNKDFTMDLKPMFRLEMAYMLLWSAIERYSSLRYHLGHKATEKVMNIAKEEAFKNALQSHVSETRKVQRADRPKQSIALTRDEPEESLLYYYQIRSNLVHRGKAAFEDFNRVKCSLEELLPIFRSVLEVAFQESEQSALSLRLGSLR